MPYTHITGTRNGRQAIFYAKGGTHQKGHNDNEQRNLYVGGVGLLPDAVMPYEDQMQIYWNRASSKNKNQIRRIIGSFSENELSPDDEQSPFIAYSMARDFVEEYYPDRQCAIFIQSDGVGNKIHFHALVNNVSITDYKGCTDEQCRFRYVADNFDKVAERYIVLDYGGQDTKDKTTQHERTMRQKNEQGENHYIWKDDLKGRIREVMSESADREDFFKRLTEHGVEGTPRAATQKQSEYILYELTDISKFSEDEKIPHSLKAKSYKLGTDYGYEALDREISKEKEDISITESVVDIAPEKTQQEIEEEKAIREEAERFAKWCKENGYEWYNSSINYMDVDRYEEAVIAYQEFLHRPEEEVFHENEAAIELDDTIPEIEPQSEEEIEMQFRKFDKGDEEDTPDEDLSIEDADNETSEAERQRQALQEKILADAAEIDNSIQLQDDFDKYFGD